MTEEQATPEVSEEKERVTIHFRIPSRMPSVYAHHLSVQEGENEVLLSFFELVPPILTGDMKERIKEVQEAGITAECVARITIAKKQFLGFAAIIVQIANRIAEESKSQTIDESESKEENDAQHSRNDQ